MKVKIARVVRIWIGMLSVVLLLTSLSPADEDPCIGELKICLQKMSKFSVPQGKNAYYMHMGIIKKMPPDSDVPDTDADVKLIISPSQMHYETQLLSVYKDEQDAFTILHPQKQIIRTKGSKIPYNSQAVGEVGTMQMEMLSQCTVASCKSIEKEGKSIKQLVLLPNASFKKKAQVKTLTFTYDSKSQTLKTIETNYLPGYSMVNEKVTIYSTDFNYKEALPVSVKSKVLGHSGKLLSAYKGYKLLDKR